MKTTLADQQAKDRNDAFRAYSRICKRTNKPEDGDSKELVQVLQLLDLTMDDFNSDLKAYQGIGDMTAKADEYEGLRKVAIEAGKRAQAKKKEVEDTVKRLELEHRELITEHLTANHQLTNARVKVEQLERTRQRHPRVFSPPAKLIGKDTARALSAAQTKTQRAKRDAAKAEQQARREAKQAASRDAAAATAQQAVSLAAESE